MWRRRALLRHLPSPAILQPAAAANCWASYGSAAGGRKGKAVPLQARGMVDRLRMRAKGGDGGNGCFSVKRTKSDRRGKPDGGNGGRGGSVILECSRSIWDFSNLQHHMKAMRGGHGLSKNQIGTRGADKIVEVPVGTVIHLVRGEQPSLVVHKPTRSLDPWDIPDAVEDSQTSCVQISDKTVKDLDADSREKKFHPSSTQLAAKGFSDRNEAKGQESPRREKSIYFDQLSNREFSSAKDVHASSYPCDLEMEEQDEEEEQHQLDIGGDGEYFVEEEEEFEEEKVRYSVAEMTKPGQRLLVARGGDGGLGNVCLAKDPRIHKVDRHPEIAHLRAGKPGIETLLILELKSIADVGLVGMPNAGKSTLLSALSRARPDIADYAFTTLRPNIGSLDYEDYFSVKVADIPGLVKGAHKNRGLGHAFLRHIERTKVLAYVLDLAAALNGRKGTPPWEQLHDLVTELEHYQEGLTRRPSLIVANKIDEEGANAMYEELKRRVQDVPIFPVCAVLQEGVPDLRVGLRNLMDVSEPHGFDLSRIIVD